MEANGKSYTIKQKLQFIQEGVGEISESAGMGFRNLSGEVVGTLYDEVSPFTDGMALVGKADEFGVLNTGILTAGQGKLVIPLSFSIKPGLFASGYARVEPKDKSEFEYAFINK